FWCGVACEIPGIILECIALRSRIRERAPFPGGRPGKGRWPMMEPTAWVLLAFVFSVLSSSEGQAATIECVHLGCPYTSVFPPRMSIDGEKLRAERERTQPIRNVLWTARKTRKCQ